MIDLINVSKSYNLKGIRKSILQNTSFQFPEDRNLAVLGANGAGKSTLLRMIAGTEPPDSGQILRSKNVSWPLGFSGGFNGSMTGLENIRFVARVYGEDTEKVIDYVREFSDLGPSLTLPIITYSSGMRARLAFGLSMAINFDCYLVDEITAVGDPQFRKKCQEVFFSKLLSKQLIMVSHSVGQIKSYCDCGIYMTGGVFHFFEDIEALIDAYESASY